MKKHYAKYSGTIFLILVEQHIWANNCDTSHRRSLKSAVQKINSLQQFLNFHRFAKSTRIDV